MEKTSKRKNSSVENKKTKVVPDATKYAKRSLSAFFFFTQHLRDEIKSKGGDVSGAKGIAKLAGEKWKAMGETEKKKFNELAAGDKLRYERELATGLTAAPRKVKSKGAGSKSAAKTTDPNKPKRSTTAYLYFVSDFRKTAECANLKASEVIKVAGAKWKELTDEQKKKFVLLEEKDKERYKKAISEYTSKQSQPAKKAVQKSKPTKKVQNDESLSSVSSESSVEDESSEDISD